MSTPSSRSFFTIQDDVAPPWSLVRDLRLIPFENLKPGQSVFIFADNMSDTVVLADEIRQFLREKTTFHSFGIEKVFGDENKKTPWGVRVHCIGG